MVWVWLGWISLGYDKPVNLGAAPVQPQSFFCRFGTVGGGDCKRSQYRMLGGLIPGTSAKWPKTMKKRTKIAGRYGFREAPGFFGWVGSGGVPIYTIPIFRAIGVREHWQNGQKPVFDFGFWAKVQIFGTLGYYRGFLRLVTGLAFWLGILIPPLLPKRSVFGILIRAPVPEEQGVKVIFFVKN